ncbi:WD repeat-containing protein 66 [Caerostris extrusa]|uniref:WD repeat-containing protein 66 n=1 Tax=Caerostris extrusa TaxID=172846 RepID=A0AAV4SWG9_CAEEX|nr:WD repeat-containing protein 66 [Caerostris extrusa]
MEIEVIRRMGMETLCTPICMTWYPIYGILTCIAVIFDDRKLWVYNLEDEKRIKIVLLPPYEEKLKKYFIFYTTCSIGLAKYPIDGNPYGSIALATHPKGIHKIAVNKEQTFLFTAGKKDSWIYMYEINLSVYSIEAEIKMLKLGGGQESMLKGEIPINCLEYVLSALGCFLSSNELQLMLDDINFENEYLHKGEKLTLNCLEIMKRIISSEEDPDKISRSRFIEILETGGDPLAENELITIVKCLKRC